MTPDRWRQVEDLYQAACNGESAGRAALLARADPEVRLAVQKMLEQPTAGSPLDSPAWEGMGNSSLLQPAIGSQIGPYQIEALLGAGGMGTVYLAADTRLRRQVAIKIPNEPLDDRFAREGRSIAALNHPNICTVYDVGPNYLVMELVEGKTLAERIRKGPIPPAEAMVIARQIAEALEAAHEKGIVHRDLKPANIKINPEGQVKVLDFGLARLIRSPEPPSQDDPTHTQTVTEAGVVVGTPSYMAPEQLLGQAVDKRADIWAFGVVLWEMLNGRRLLSGGTTAQNPDVLRDQIDFGTLTAPAPIVNLLRRCLDRDVKTRLRDIGEARIAIQKYLANPESGAESLVPTADRPTAGRSGRVRSVWIAAAVFGMIAVALALIFFHEKPVEQPLERLDVDLGPDVSLSSLTGPSTVALSPDGTQLTYMVGNPSGLFLRRLDQLKAVELPGTRGASMPFFSPDGRWVGFFARGKLNKTSVEGGAVFPLSTSTVPVGASWGEDGSIVLSLGAGKGLGRISSAGGAPVMLTETTSGELVHGFPQVLPGGKAVLFVSFSTPMDVDHDTIDVVTIADRRRKTLVRGGVTPHYSPTGHLIYTNKSTLFAIPFDLDKLETRGAAVPILDDVAFHPPTAGAQYAVSQNGTLVYRKHGGGLPVGMMTVQWLDPSGKREPLLGKPAVYLNPRLSPDGGRLALTIADGPRRNIWIHNRARDAMTRLTSSGTNDYPVWSPDGRYVVFLSAGAGIFWTRSDGAGQPQPLVEGKDNDVPWSFTPDGKRLAYFPTASLPQIWTVPLEDRGGQLKAAKPEQFLKSQFVDKEPSFSPDGRWLAYDSNESGSYQVYVQAFPPSASSQGGKWQISDSGGDSPIWSSNGRDLLYRSNDQLMAVNYAVRGEVFESDKPRVWIAKLLGTWASLTPDGKRVAVLSPMDIPEAPPPEHEVVFVLNFFDELRRKVPK